MKPYPTYRGLPPLGGLCSVEEAMNPGLSVEQCVTRLKRCHYAFKRLHQIFTARITAEPILELKNAFSLHSHICAEHTSALRKRVAEMREPPLGLEEIPHPSLEIAFDEILAAPERELLISGLYAKAIPALKASLEKHIADTNKLVDAPSVRLIRFALLEIEDMLAFGKQAVESLTKGNENPAWLALLDAALAEKPVERQFSKRPYEYDRVPKRDERFADPYNMGVNAEAFLYDPQYPPQAKTVMMFYKRLREVDVPEMMASIITETTGKPWEYYRDMTRQLWDEARHSMMGEVGFVQLGSDWPKKVMVNFTWSLGLNTQLTPIERHAVLYFIEQGLMPKNGKRFEWEVGQKSGNPLSALFQDYDWADEVLHAKIGRDWYLKDFDNPQDAIRYGDQCWSKVLIGWREWRDKGLTQHRNWWPEVYRDACKAWGVQPDPKSLAFNTTYEQVRADLKAITGSA